MHPICFFYVAKMGENSRFHSNIELPWYNLGMEKIMEKIINFINSEYSGRMLAKFCAILMTCAIVMTSVFPEPAGADEDVLLHLQSNPLTSDVIVNDANFISDPNLVDAQVTAVSSGVSPEDYSHDQSSESNLASNTFTITSQTTDSGVPIEIIDVEEFTPDGADYWVSCTEANVRSLPNVDSEIVGHIYYADQVRRLTYGQSWSFVRLEDGTEGYCLNSFLSSEEIVPPTATPTPTSTPRATATPVPAANNAPAETTTPTQNNVQYEETSYSARVYASCSLNLRSGPDTSYSLVRVLNAGDEIDVVAQTSNGWYRTVNGNYVKASLCTDTPPAPPADNGGSGDATNDFSSYCLSFVGCPYVYAGMSPSGFDCSGFVSYVFANYYGISLPHSADSISDYGYAVSADEVQVGDIICNDHNYDGYMDHVSVYIGDNTVVHASTSTTGVITSTFSNLNNVATIRRIL